LIISATQGHFFRPGKNSLSLKQLARLTKTPLRDLRSIWGWPKQVVFDQRQAIMNIKAFQQVLKAEFEYRSPEPRRLLTKKLPGWAATVFYYMRLLSLIYNSSRVAKRRRYSLEKWASDSQSILGFVEEVGGRHHVSGMKEMAKCPGPVVFIANHMSMLDTFLLPGLILPFHRVTFVVKDSLLRYPVFGAIMQAVRPIALERKHPRKDLKVVINEGQRMIRNGNSIVIFPQSTRSVRFDAANFNSLGVKLAKQAGTFVVPLALKTDFQANGRFIKEMGGVNPKKMVHIKFGRPLPVTGNGQKTHQAVINFIEENLLEWGGEIRRREGAGRTPV
jgi:1-acyl-sn-glycerol-3-phosphate acyltransferase